MAGNPLEKLSRVRDAREPGLGDAVLRPGADAAVLSGASWEDSLWVSSPNSMSISAEEFEAGVAEDRSGASCMAPGARGMSGPADR